MNTLVSILFCFDGLSCRLTSIWPYTFFPRGKEVFKINTCVFITKRLFYKAWPCGLSELHGCDGHAVVLRKCCCSQLKRVFLWLHPNRQSVWHRPDFSLEQPHHDNMSDGHVCPLIVVSVLWYFMPEFRNTVSFKGALSRSVTNYKFHEMFDMAELFGRTFKPFPKLSSVICFIKHASNFALEHVSSWHAGSSV